MPRHHDSSEFYESEREYTRPRRSEKVTEYEDVEIRSGRRDRDTEFLREDYGRTSSGPLVVREEEVIEESRSSGRRRRPEREREYVEEEVVISKRDRERERPRREEVEEEIHISKRDREGDKPRREEVGEEIRVSKRDRERDRPRREIIEEEEIVLRDRREPARPRGHGSEREEVREEVIYRRGDRGPESDASVVLEKEEYVYRPRDRSPPVITREREEWHYGPRRREREENIDREEITIRREERESGHGRDYEEEEISMRRTEREASKERSRGYREEDLSIRYDHGKERPWESRFEESSRSRERTRPRSASFEREEIRIRRDERDGTRGKRSEKDEIIIRREREKSPASSIVTGPLGGDEPEVIRAPPIHQEIITHHRHIDHGYTVKQPFSAPPDARSSPRPRSPSPKTVVDEIEIRRRGERNGRRYDDDIIIDTRRKTSPAPSRNGRHRSASLGARSRHHNDDSISGEANFYARKNNERAYTGEAYHGAVKDWAIVDVPPGTSRVKMDGIGGASQEITWQRYNGVRRSEFLPEGGASQSPYGSEVAERPRRYECAKSKTDSMWTEITKDLVTKEAIESCGYDYEETEFFFYVMVYLRYEDVLRLVDISEDLRRDRRQRIRQIEWERKMPPMREPEPRKMLEQRSYEEDRIYEHEVVYRRSPPLRRREEIKETVYAMR